MAPEAKKQGKPAGKARSTKQPAKARAATSAKPKPARAAKATTTAKAKATAAKPKPATAAKRKPTAKLPVAALRELEASLQRDEPAWQVQGVSEVLATLGARAPAVADALLLKTRKGHPFARAYLAALGDSENAVAGANAFVRHCAMMERGRKALRGAFAAVWRKATDVAAIAEAYKNFARGLLDDPELLDAALDAAVKLGDTAGATSLAARLERSQRLAPLLVELAGAAPRRARAKQRVMSLPAPDRWHVYARVIDNPRAYDQDLAVDAVRALADDPNVTDMALSAAIVDMRYHGNDRLVAEWKLRVEAGDGALITRLLGLFEWTALWATDDSQLEPYIRALSAAGGRPEAFASVEHALAGNSMVVRHAVLEQWLCDADAISAFDDAQVDKLIRMAVTIAEAGDDTSDRRAANRALFHTPHPGARHALMDGLRHASTAKNPELRRNLYSGLSHIDHPDVLPFLVEQLFVERDEYSILLDAIAARIDATTNVRVLGTLVERAGDPNAVHAAAAYADALLRAKLSPRLALDLARVVIGWQPTTNDDARRLRYIFEQATVAALDLMRPDDARTFLARAGELPDAPYSDYIVKQRDQKTPAQLAEPVTKQRLIALEAGELDAQIARTRAAAEAARAAGKPIDADDARLGILAGCTVSGRFFEDKAGRVVWFFDELGALHVYDGYSVVAPPCQVTGVASRGTAPADMAAFIAGHPMIDERALFFDAKSARAREVLRLGDRILVHDGSGRDGRERIAMPVIGLRFATTADAKRLFERLVVAPPPGTRRIDPWYVERAGAVRRAYTCCPGDARLAVIGSQIEGEAHAACPFVEREHPTSHAAIAALEAWETRVLAAGGRMTHLWIDAPAGGRPRVRTPRSRR
jgi:hypothetical protein